MGRDKVGSRNKSVAYVFYSFDQVSQKLMLRTDNSTVRKPTPYC